MVTIESIGNKLGQIERTDPTILNDAHGADSHRYQMLPPIKQSELASWENHHGIRLPHTYASFLTLIGNGPCGPGFGLAPFPHENPNACNECKILGPITSEENDSADRYDETVADQSGFIRLADYGCAMYAVLILTGDFTGQIWLDGAGSGDITPFPPVLHDLSRDDSAHSKLNFLEWYDDWLDCALDGRAIP